MQMCPPRLERTHLAEHLKNEHNLNNWLILESISYIILDWHNVTGHFKMALTKIELDRQKLINWINLGC